MFAALSSSILLIAFAVRYCWTKRPEQKKRQWAPMSTEAQKKILDKHQQIESLRGHLMKGAVRGITVSDVMTTNVAWADEQTSVDTLKAEMRQNGTRHLMIRNKAGELLGVVSARDVAGSGRTAAEIMTRDPITVDANSPVRNAIASMLSNRISCLPVLSYDELCGVVTTTDILMAFDCLVELYQEKLSPSDAEAISV
jgi:acetoin utilization protein AcuB